MNGTIITQETPLGGARYPFLHRLERPWKLISRPRENVNTPSGQPFNMSQPTLRWVNGGIHDLYVEGMATDDFLATSSLALSMKRGGFVLSKRLSRLMRPYFLSGFFPKESVTIEYLELNDRGLKVWDGAGLVSRALLRRLIDHLPENLSAGKRRELVYELEHAGRIEFTLMGAGHEHASYSGQNKGHAIVVDDLRADFILPKDTKPEVKLLDDTLFIGLYPVHSADHMRLDIQSLINLRPFFETEPLTTWLNDEGALFIQAVESGAVGEAFARVDADTSMEQVESWYLREYLASGGHPMWFGSIVRGLMNQHLARLNHTTRDRVRLPIPGGRYYVMTDVVAGRRVLPGHIELDPRSGTAWVNAGDWCDFIADVLGGADQDDALWIHPFTDFDGQRMFLAWRSPNQCGEYVILRPAEGGHIPTWQTIHGEILCPRADSRRLPPRMDTVLTTYLNLVDETRTGEVETPYSIEAIHPTIERMQANHGVLGQYCNLLMVTKALYDRLPARPPAPLETIIDASVKTGADLSAVRDWCYQASQKILRQRRPVPVVLLDRLSVGGGAPPVTTSGDHWLDELMKAVADHIAVFTQERDRLMAAAMPPRTIFDHALSDPALIPVGARLNSLYTGTLKQVAGHFVTDEIYDLARNRCQALLDAHPPEQRTAIILAAIAHYYIGEAVGRDAAVWQIGVITTEGRQPGIARLTIRALREVGVLDEISETVYGTLRYPGAKILEPVRATIGINGIWYNYLGAWLQQHDRDVPATMNDVSKAQARWAKERVERLAQTGVHNLRLAVRMEGERKLAYTERGNLFGYISKDSADRVGERITIRLAIARDGNLRCVVD